MAWVKCIHLPYCHNIVKNFKVLNSETTSHIKLIARGVLNK